MHFWSAPRDGLEPPTQWLTAICSTDWATGELKTLYIYFVKVNSSPENLTDCRAIFLSYGLWLQKKRQFRISVADAYFWML